MINIRYRFLLSYIRSIEAVGTLAQENFAAKNSPFSGCKYTCYPAIREQAFAVCEVAAWYLIFTLV